MKLKTKAWPDGRNWPDDITLDVGSNMPHDVYGIADEGAGVLYIRHDIATAQRTRAEMAEQCLKEEKQMLKECRYSRDKAWAEIDSLRNKRVRS